MCVLGCEYGLKNVCQLKKSDWVLGMTSKLSAWVDTLGKDCL
jgi:hypothetical protein